MAADIDPKSLEKLKELESNIAKELDQKVTLSEPTDPRLDGSVQLNPSLDLKAAEPKAASPAPTVIPGPTPATAAAPAAGAATEGQGPINSNRNVEDITLEEVDDLLKDADSSFAAAMDEIKKEVSQVQVTSALESISIGADYLKEEGKGDEAESEDDTSSDDLADEIMLAEKITPGSAGAYGVSIWTLIKEILLLLLILPINLAKILFKQALLMKGGDLKQILLDTIPLVKSLLTAPLEKISKFTAHLKSYTRVQYIKFGILVVLIGALTFIGKDIVHHSRPGGEKDPFLKSFDEVATSKVEMTNSGPEEEKGSPIPEFVVALPRLVANLKSDGPKHQPMVAMELFIEASDRDTAVEVQNRNTEVRDTVARLLEQTTFKQMDEAEGKEKLKQRIKMSLNRILNNGRIQSIFFKSIQIRE